MCGIAAILGKSSPPGTAAVRRHLTGLLSRIAHRGEPQFQAEIATGPGWALGTNRLAITSDAGGPQPLVSKDRNVTLVFNGEIYNYRALASEYGVDSYSARHDGDGAVAAAVLAQDGVEGLRRFDGMFGMVCVDTRTNEAILARDHIGIKPLYYALTDGTVLVASEIKSLAAEPAVSDIRLVPPGTYIRVNIGGPEARILETSRWFPELGTLRDDRVTTKELRLLLHESVQLQSAYPGPIGVYLSGGVDSSGIYALARKYHKQVIPLILDSREGPDGMNARRLVSAIGGEPVIAMCPSEEELFSEVRDTVRIVESFEPNVVRQSSVQRYIAALAMQKGIKVILCGEGADELFCGYPEFWDEMDRWDDLRLS